MTSRKKPKRVSKRPAVRRGPKAWPRGTVFTVGHSTRSVDELIGLLKQAGVDLLVDVRSIPRSRTNPQFNTDALPAPLAAAGIGYRHAAALGGRRHHRKGDPPSPNGFWQNAAFRSYADYAMGPESAPGSTSSKRCATAIVAPSCARKPSGGGATAASSRTTC